VNQTRALMGAKLMTLIFNGQALSTLPPARAHRALLELVAYINGTKS